MTLLQVLFVSLMTLAPFLARSADRLKFSDITKPEFFPIFAWDGCRGWDGKSRDYQVHGMESMIECNFNLAGFVSPKELTQCRKLGLGAIVIPPRDMFDGFKYSKAWKNLSDQEI